jgi:hypothetical protein
MNLLKAIAPAKSNGCLLDGIKTKNYGLYLDYLVINLQGIPNQKSTFTLDFEDYGTRVFHKRCTISDKTEKIATLLFEKRSDTIKIEDFAQIKLENHLFYTKTLTQIKGIIDKILKELDLKFYSFNRLDIALDYQNASDKMLKLYESIVNKKVLIGGKPKDFNQFNVYGSTSKGEFRLEGMQIGSRKSGRFCRLYDKTLELEKSNKTYISDSWKNAKIKGNVWRFEYQLNSSYLRSIESLSLETLFDSEYLMDLFHTAQNNHFILHFKKRRKEVNKMPVFNFFNWENIKNAVTRNKNKVLDILPKIKRTIKESLLGQKRLCKALLRSYCSSSQRIEYVLAMKVLIHEFKLESWFETKRPYYFEEFARASILKNFDRCTYNEHITLDI